VALPISLWVDDVRPVPDWANATVTTAKDAIACLRNGNVVRISLDHDLGPPEAGTGYDVACFVEQAAYEGTLPLLQWSIHSANGVGRARMEQALKNADQFWAEKRSRQSDQ
jgi:hypothetical protein